jgi:hypothetical protein
VFHKRLKGLDPAGHAPQRLHDEITAGYTGMIYAATAGQVEDRRKAFIRTQRLRHRPIRQPCCSAR